MQIKTYADAITERQHLNMLVYSQAGVGKTTLSTSSAVNSKTLLLDCESGANFIPKEFTKNLSVVDFGNPKNIIAELKELVSYLKVNKDKFEVLIIDSCTELLKKVTDATQGNNDTVSLRDWGVISNVSSAFFRAIRDLPMHTILVCLEKEITDEEKLVKRPALSPASMSSSLAGMVDVCGYMTIKDSKRYIVFEPNVKFYAKDRTGKLNKFIENPTMDIIFNQIFNTKQPIVQQQQVEEDI